MEITYQAAEFKSLGLFRDFIEMVCKPHPQVDEQTLYDLKLAADEACTNIIAHGYTANSSDRIALGCEVDGESVRLMVIDHGQPFRLSEPVRPDIDTILENGALGGFGLYFVYQTMDEVVYEAKEDANCLMLTKKLRSQ